jgi:hypothetical protein
MKNFSLTQFLEQEGFILLDNSLGKTVNGCQLTIQAVGVNKVSKQAFTFYLFMMPNPLGGVDTWLSCFDRKPIQ